MLRESPVVRNFLTFDVEDWYQTTLDVQADFGDEVVQETHEVLDALARFSQRGTFFVLGRVAEQFPGLVRDIARGGHEVATHGYSHVEVHRLGREAFGTELRRAVAVLEDLVGQKVVGHRAPRFSLPEALPWACDVMAECGLQYDSSIFPSVLARNGTTALPRTPFTLYGEHSSLREFPLATLEAFRQFWPIAGGGYFRLLPYSLLRRLVRAVNARGEPAVLYFHPYEVNPQLVAPGGITIPKMLQVTQKLNRRKIPGRLQSLLQDFRFAPLRERLATVP